MDFKKAKKASYEQKIFLLSYMERNANFAQDRFESSEGTHEKHRKWMDLTDKLNNIQGAYKDVNQWRKFWTDQKLRAKDREALLKASVLRRGKKGVKKLRELSTFEKRVVTLMANGKKGRKTIKKLSHFEKRVVALAEPAGDNETSCEGEKCWGQSEQNCIREGNDSVEHISDDHMEPVVYLPKITMFEHPSPSTNWNASFFGQENPFPLDRVKVEQCTDTHCNSATSAVVTPPEISVDNSLAGAASTSVVSSQPPETNSKPVRKEQRATSGRRLQTAVLKKLLNIETQKLEIKKKEYILLEQKLKWKKEYEMKLLETKERELQLREKELEFKRNSS